MQQYHQPQYAPPPHYQYTPPPHHQPGMSQIYPPPPTMARASSASSVTPTPQEQGATYTMEEMEQILGSNSLGFPDEDHQKEDGSAFRAAIL
jgi:hypothetical protein